MNNPYKIALVFLGIFYGTRVLATCDPTTQDKIERATPFELFGIIDTTKINAFDTDELILKDSNTDQVRAWDSLLECTQIFVTHLIDSHQAFSFYQQYFPLINETNDFIKNNVRTLHKKFSGFFQKDTSLFTRGQKQSITAQDYQYLHALKREIQTYQKKIQGIVGVALQKIDISFPTPNEWYAKTMQPIQDLFPCYKEFFTSYYLAKKNSKTQNLSAQELLYFIAITNVFNSKCLKKAYHDDMSKAAILVDVLNKLEYQLLHEPPKSIPSKERTTMIAASKEIIDGLQKAYPHMITETHFKKLSLTKDKASIIMFAEAKSLLSILDEIYKKINQLLTKKSE